MLTKFEDRLEEIFTIDDLTHQLESLKTVLGFQEEVEENVANYEPPEAELEIIEEPVYHYENPKDPDEWLSIIFVNDNNSISKLRSNGAHENADENNSENNLQKFLTDADETIENKSEINSINIPTNTSTASEETKHKRVNISPESKRLLELLQFQVLMK